MDEGKEKEKKGQALIKEGEKMAEEGREMIVRGELFLEQMKKREDEVSMAVDEAELGENTGGSSKTERRKATRTWASAA